MVAGLLCTSTAAAKPCAKHTGTAKAACVKQAKANAQRDSARWPPYPVTMRDLTVRGVQWRKFVNLAKCEAGYGSGAHGVRWNTPSGWEYQGGLGMYSRSHASTGHPYGYDAGQWNWQTQVLVGERLRLMYGVSAWSAASCWR